jgi:hypothetical protein
MRLAARATDEKAFSEEPSSKNEALVAAKLRY